MLEGLSALQGLGLGSFGVLVLGVLTFLGNSYFKKRSSNREDTKSERESESGIVETTRVAIAMVRNELVTMGGQLEQVSERSTNQRVRIEELENEAIIMTRRLEAHELKIESQSRRIRELEKENKLLKTSQGSS